MDDYDDALLEDDESAPYCECGAIHSIEELDTNQCDCCGKPIEIENTDNG